MEMEKEKKKEKENARPRLSVGGLMRASERGGARVVVVVVRVCVCVFLTVCCCICCYFIYVWRGCSSRLFHGEVSAVDYSLVKVQSIIHGESAVDYS